MGYYTLDNKNEEAYTPPSDEEIFKNFPWEEFQEIYKTPVKSRLMLQEPELPKELKKIASSMCPPRIKEFIKAYKRVGPEAFSKKFTKLLPRVTILHGPNGTGKSTLGMLIAKKLKAKLVFINSGFLGTMYRNSEEVNLSEIIAPLLNEGTPCVVVFDEADAIVGKTGREDNFNKNRSTAVGQMMDMLEKRGNFILVWTTNHINQIGKKFKDRCGIYRIIEIPLPSFEQRKKILEYLEEEAKNISDESLELTFEETFKLGPDSEGRNLGRCFQSAFSDSIAKKTDGFSIRDLEKLFKEVFVRASARLPKKINNKTQIAIFTRQDFNELSNIIKKELTRDKSRLSREKILKVIKEWGLIGVGTTIFVATGGAVLTIVLAKHKS